MKNGLKGRWWRDGVKRQIRSCCSKPVNQEGGVAVWAAVGARVCKDTSMAYRHLRKHLKQIAVEFQMCRLRNKD